ncbi:MAG: DUF1929 domain-containing protein [Chloroflexi bacterium]|nr:DUF1929 domain-containing protein [Chloroflexota bacterium]
MAWLHSSPIIGHPLEADLDVSLLELAARFAVAGDFDGDGRAEIAIAPEGSGNNGSKFWIVKYDAGRWIHLSPLADNALQADLDCANVGFAAKFLLAGDFDGDKQDEFAACIAESGSGGNDFWVMKFDNHARVWNHFSQFPWGHPLKADLDCGGINFPAKFAVAADFDGDGDEEIAAAVDAPGNQGNDFWVMKYEIASNFWFHMGHIPGSALGADIDCSASDVGSRFAVTGDFDGDGKAELAVAFDARGADGNKFWVMKYNAATDAWEHLSPIAGDAHQADLKCSSLDYAAKFAVAGDFDGDGQDELAACTDAVGSGGNDFWVMKFDKTTRAWNHFSPFPGAGHPLQADMDCGIVDVPAKFAVAADFDGDTRDEIAIAADAPASAGNDFWVMKFDTDAIAWPHFSQIPAHPLGADIDASTLLVPAKFALVADFRGAKRNEIAIALDAPASAGNDFWIMRVATPEEEGRWQVAPLSPDGAQILAVHAALVPPGKVLYFSGSDHDADLSAAKNIDHTRLYDPVTNKIEIIGSPNFDVFCSGHAFLADGKLLVAGGTHEYDVYPDPLQLHPFRGLRGAAIFNSNFKSGTNPWTEMAPMNFQRDSNPPSGGGRWYPTLLTLADGRVMAVSGLPDDGDTRRVNYTVEVFDPAQNIWLDLGDQRAMPGVYPRMHLLPDGQVIMTSPMAKQTQKWDLQTNTWNIIADGPSREYAGVHSTSVLLPLLPDENYRARILLAGAPQALLLDLGAPMPAWVATQPRALAGDPERNHLNAVMLPNGTILFSGGSRSTLDVDAVRIPELYDPTTGQWTTLAQENVIRNYHSTALLLPDGRVWTGGSNLNGWRGEAFRELRMELFEPPYLFAGARPRVSGAPATLTTTNDFEIESPDAKEIQSVCLIRCGSVTHSFNFDQRYVGLAIKTRAANKLVVAPPPNSNIAPPGNYLLFVLNAAGVPSVGKFVLVNLQIEI